jgi:hypothetical protein
MKRTLIGLLAVAVIGGMLFSGCVAPPPEPPVTAEPTPEGTPIPVPMPTDPNSVLIGYDRSGGIMGLRDKLTIYTDGRCELRRIDGEWEFTIPPSQLEHLKELMEEANFLDLKVPDLPPPIADSFEYVIYYNPGVGKVNTVRVRTTAIPDCLGPIMHELAQIISSNS